MLGLQIVSTINSFFSPIDKYIISPLKEHISYALDYTKNVAELRHKVETLGGARDNLQNSVHDACRRGDEIQKNVEKWLADAENAIEEAEKLIQSEEEAKKNRCFAGLCPNLKGRYQLGKKAAEEASAIVNLENEGKFDTSQISYRPAPQQKVSSSVHGFEGLPSRASILKQVMDAVTDPSVNIIGVSGMGGLGKTTLVKEVHKQAIEGKLFDVVALVTLSEKAELERIQCSIAEVLGLKLEEETIEVRANRLQQRLMKEKKVLIILDNLWERIDLESLGIPLTNKQWVSSRGAASIIEPEEDDHKGSTILLTSRNRDLLSCEMGAQREFPLDLLEEEESLSLLKRMVGDLKVQESLAIDVAKKCAGLPLLLVTVAIGLKNKEFEVWKDTLKRLSTFDDQEIQKKVHSVLELSYDGLASEEVQSFFLLCGLFPHADISILDLLKYSMGLGLFKHINTVQDARNRVHKLIGDLKSSFLLLDSEKDGYVKIHDVVKDIATSIASRTQLAFKKVGGSLGECRSVDFKCFTRIVLEDADISEFPLQLQCPEIELFRLSTRDRLFTRDRSVKIPDSWFDGMTKLKVLNFIGMCFSSLPSSLSSATSLHTLCLDSCQLQEISAIWQLKNLEVLSLMYSDIVELPRDLAQLTRLKMLDLSNCYQLEFIPENVFSRLSLLEELHMANSFTSWEVKRLDNQTNASLSELEHLSRLTNLEINVPDARKLPEALFFERLERFKISIGDGWYWWGTHQTSRALKVKLDTSIHSWGHGVKILLKKVENLFLDELKGVTNVLYDLHKEGFPQLKQLLVQKSSDIRYVIDLEGRLPFDAFPVLESLILYNLVNLEKICRGQLMAGDFCQLKILRVRSCNKLKNLFPFSMVRNLKQLCEMEVINCKDIEEIFASETEEEDDDKNEVFEFTQLCFLKLQLPLLQRFCSKVKSSPASTSSTRSRQNQSTIDPRGALFDEMIVFPNLKELKLCSIAVENIWWNRFGDHTSFYNLTSLNVEACRKINYLLTSEMVRNLSQLQRLEICQCELMKEVIVAEGETTSTSFPKLEFLNLEGLSKLVRFCNVDFMEFPSLKKLSIENCPALKSFISNPIATASGNNLALFDEKVAFPNIEELRIEDMNGLKTLWYNELNEGSFCKLKTLTIRRAEELVNVFPSSLLMSRFLNVEHLNLDDCELLEEVFNLPTHEEVINISRTHEMPTCSLMKTLWIKNLPNLKHIWKDAREKEIIFFTKLHAVNVSRCPSLKSIFPASVASCLLQFRELNIAMCGIEEIIDRGGNTETIPKFEFPQLTTLRLDNLKELKVLYPRIHTSDWPMLEKLHVHACPKVEIFSLESRSIGGKGWRSQSENPSRQPFFIVEKFLFPNLKELELSSIAVENIWWNRFRDHASFYNLTSLTVKACKKVNILFTSAMIRNLGQLQRLKICKCESMEGVIAAEGETISDTSFTKLEFLKLKGLPKLVRFCNGDFMELPSLKELWIENCPTLKSFLSNPITTASEANLALFDEKVAFPNIEELHIEDTNGLKTIWHNELNEGSFCKLKTLTIRRAEELVNVFPSSLLMSRFLNVEHLNLDDCELLEEVFNLPTHEEVINFSRKQEMPACSLLKNLWIRNLPNLKHIWKKDIREREIISFQKLHEVDISQCLSLKSIFPTSIGMYLLELKELTIRICGIEEIVDRQEDTETIPKFEFFQLTTLTLYNLNELKTLYSGMHISNWPMLEKLRVHDCPKVEIFYLESQSIGGKGLRSQLENPSPQPFFTVEKVIPNLEELTLNSTDAKLILNGLCPEHLFDKVRLLHLQSFDEDSASVLLALLGRFCNLESLDVRDNGLTELFSCEGLINEENQGRTLPRIRKITLDLLYKLKRVCKQDWQLDHIFESLETLEVWRCDSLISLVPSINIASFGNLSHLDIWKCDGLLNLVTFLTAPCLGLLTSLSVRECSRVKEVVAKEDDERNDQITWGKLKTLKLYCLSNLTYFSSAYHTFKFPSLEEVTVTRCPEMKAFSRGASITPKLKRVKLTEGYNDKGRWEGGLNTTIQQLYAELAGLDGIEHLELSEHPQLKEKWHKEEFPANFFSNLSSLMVDECASLSIAIPSNLLPFLDNLLELEVKNCDLVEELFNLTLPHAEDGQNGTLPKLNKLQLIDLPSLKHVWNEEPKGFFDFRSLKVFKVHNCATLKYVFIATTCLGLVRLRELEVKDCPLIEEIISKEATTRNVVFPLLSSIALERLPNLTSFYPGNGTVQCPLLQKIAVVDCSTALTFALLNVPPPNATNHASQAKIVFPNLKELKLSSIAAENIWWNQFRNHSFFYNLTSLTVEACRKINYLFTLAMVRNIGQLQRLEICECKSMEGVIATEGETISKVEPFPKLEFLKLKGLLKLAKFCRGDFIELPSLKELWIENCPSLKSFISNPIATNSGANLALFDEKVAFPNLEELRIEDMNGLKTMWHNELHEGSFCKLKTMIVRQAEELVNGFPTNMLMSRFLNLEHLDLIDCELLEEVFDLPPHKEFINFSRSYGMPASQLKNLCIQNLPNLKHIWKKDAPEREIIFFHKLQYVTVSGCPSLQSIFPAFIGTCLLELKELTIEDCGIEEIVDRGEDKETISKFEFSQLTSLKLYNLWKLKMLCSGIHISDWPMLNSLLVKDCPEVEIFSLESGSSGGKGSRSQSENSSRQPLFIVEKVIPNLEELTLNSKDAKLILNGLCPDHLFDKVRLLHLQSFDKESASFLFTLLRRFRNLEKFEMFNNWLPELFSCEALINEENQGRTISRIKHMSLNFLYKLQRFCEQDCQLDHIFKSLESSEVWRCDSLINLVPSINIAFFRNLSHLDVWQCQGLLNLVTSSTAQCLGLLTELSIRECNMVSVVVAREEDDKEDQITWGNLKSLELHCLSSLTYFCSACHSFKFPSLEKVIVTRCPKMKAFSRGVAIAPKLKRVNLVEGYDDKGRWKGDLNTTIQQLCAELVGLDGIEHLELSEHPQLKEKWHKEELPANFFSNLSSLMVDECASLSVAIPSNLLPFLDNLLKLEVKNCDFVEEVFDLTLPNAADGQIRTLPKLKKLKLVDLPKLKHVWNEEPKGFFDFRNVKVLKVHNCATLKYIFTPTVCLGLVRLQKLEVKDCPLIEEIISKEATSSNVVFPLLSSIALECLPNLTSFYPGSGTVQCPLLLKIAVIECSTALTLAFLKELPPNATNHVSQAKIVFSNLKELQLSSIKVEEIWTTQHIAQFSCFQHLTTLIVEDCGNLRYLFTSSMVEYLDQIKRLDICNCKSIEEVVLKQVVGGDESSSKMLFPKVEVLKLKGLPKLSTFCTCSLLECPVLKELQIDNCPQLKSLVADVANRPASADVAPSSQIDNWNSPLFDEKVAFPDVEKLIICNMPWLKLIWRNEVLEDSFCKLRILKVEQVEALSKVFPSTMLVKRFQNLEELFIQDCESLEVVFDNQELMINVEETHPEAASQAPLKTLRIENLPKLKHVWNADTQELLFFQNLNSVIIRECPNLRSIFPASVARGLLQLQFLNIAGCGIEEIVEKEKQEETTAPAFVFLKLTHLWLSRLPELKRFYPGMHTSEWPALKFLAIHHCDKMHILEFQRFQEEEEVVDGNQVVRSLFSFREVIPNLEALALTCKEATMIWECQFPEKIFDNIKTLLLECFHDKSAVLPSGFLELFPNIGELILLCHQRRELFPNGLIGEGKHARPTYLRLEKFPNARNVEDQDSQIDQLLQNIDVLELSMCDGLTNLAPFSASFQSITSLDIFKCRALVHLFSLSAAETLLQLRTMIVNNCDTVTEIIANTGHDAKHETVFHKLESLVLHHLPSLTSFCSGEHPFKFPSLTEVIVSQCPKMEIFSKGVLRTPKLRSVKLTQQKDRECWNDNLNKTIQHLYKKMVGFHGLQDLRLINFPNLKEAWHNEFPAECFYNLTSLVVENCASFLNAVPSSLLSFLNRLKKLDVRNCDSLEEVFRLEKLGANPEHPVLSKLNEFLLSDLPRLRHIWNEAFCGILGFKNLKLLKIHNCSSLEYIVTPTMALSLVQIQELEVKNCTSVEEIIISGEEEAVVNTMFSQLDSLVLESLPNLTSFCSLTNVLELQSLEKVKVVDCPRIELFASTILRAQEPNVVVTNEGRLDQERFSTPAVLLFGAKVTCKNLKELKVECNNNTKGLLHGKLPTEYSAKIEVLELVDFPHEETLFPSDILLRFPSLEKLVVNNAYFEELFLEQRIVDKKNSDEQVTNLRQLKLSKLPKLSQLFQDHSIPDLVIQNLETLEVIECIGLKILMPSSLSFQNLTTLEVSKCHGLSNLITCSAAKSLEKLTRMTITECDMLEEIVASEGNGGEAEIAFRQLKHLGLHCLPNLVGFCSENHTFNFPSLEEVTLRECSKMRFFSEGVLLTPRLMDVQIAVDEDQWHWEGNLNTIVQQLFSEMGVENA